MEKKRREIAKKMRGTKFDFKHVAKYPSIDDMPKAGYKK